MTRSAPQSIVLYAGLALAAGAVIFAALQYPLQTTFPIGGDAVRYAARAQELRQAIEGGSVSAVIGALSNSHYPLTITTLAIASWLPLSWPDLFVWAMALGYIFFVSAATLLSWRLSGIRPALVVALGLALTTVNVTRFFEDGLLAQLLSVGVLLFAYERFCLSRFVAGSVLLVLASLLHPLTAVFSALVGAALVFFRIFSGQRWATQETITVWAQSGVTMALFFGATVLVIWRGLSLSGFASDSQPVDISQLLETAVGPLLVLAVPGMVLTAVRRPRQRVLAHYLLLSFVIVATALSFGDFFGHGLLMHRWRAYFLVGALLVAGPVLESVGRFIFNRALGAGLIFFALAGSAMAVVAITDARYVYNFYESSSHYARPHPDEVAAMKYLDSDEIPGGIIVTTNANRNSEWVSLLSERTHESLPEGHSFFTSQLVDRSDLPSHLKAAPIVVLFFHHRDSLNLRHAAPIWENNSVSSYYVRAR